MNTLKDWVRSGGKVIAIDAALRSFAGKDGFSLKYKENESEEASDNLIPYAERERQYSNNMITGAIFKSKVDTTHPMAFGYSKTYYSLKQGSESYQLIDDGFNIGYIDENAISVAGFSGEIAKNNLKELP